MFDRIDLKILDLLQRDATMPVARIADRVGLSQTPCWKRIQKHQASRTIRSRVAILDPDAFGLSLVSFLTVEPAEATPDWRAAFLAAIEGRDEVQEVFRLAGSQDYLLKVVSRDLAAFETFCDWLTSRVAVRATRSVFAQERFKAGSALPLVPTVA